MIKAFNKLIKVPLPQASYSLIQKPCFSYVSPVLKLNVQSSETPAVIERKPDSILVNQWWSQSPFDEKKPIFVPVFNFQTGEFVGENVELHQDVFNRPLRRDILFRAFQWRKVAGKYVTHITRTKGTTAGSGIKPSPQKGQGKARWGNKRAPGRRKGGKAHGPQPRIIAYPLNRKIRLLAYKTLFSAKLAEGKLRVIDSEEVEEPKTRLVAEPFKGKDSRITYMIVTSIQPQENFITACKNIPNVQTCTPMKLNICDLLTVDRIYITKEGVEDLVQVLQDRTFLQYRKEREYDRELTPSEEKYLKFLGKERHSKKIALPEYDPSRPLNLKFKVLQQYLEDYEKYQKGEYEIPKSSGIRKSENYKNAAKSM